MFLSSLNPAQPNHPTQTLLAYYAGKTNMNQGLNNTSLYGKCIGLNFLLGAASSH